MQVRSTGEQVGLDGTTVDERARLVTFAVHSPMLAHRSPACDVPATAMV
jgi:hypothetical protein